MPKSKIKSTKDASVLEADIEMGLTDKDDNHNESSDPEKKKKESEKKEVENYLLQEQFLSVDKGIFRRKLKNAERKHAELVKDRAFRKNANEKKSKLEGKNSGDEGLDSQSKKAKEVLDAPDSDDDVKMDLQSFKTHGTAETAGKKKKKPAAADKTSFFSGLFSILGIGANASIYPVDNSYEAVAKSEEEAIFLNGGDDYSEHRRRLIKKWKDNVRAKMGKLETMDSSDEDDFDEVRY